MAITIYGKNPVFQVLTTHPELIKTLYLQKLPLEWKLLIKEKQIVCHLVKPEILNSYANSTHHQGVVAILSQLPTQPLTWVMKLPEQKPHPLILILDRINDPHNYGAILRTAAACMVDAVIVLNRDQAPISGVVAKASAGGFLMMPIIVVHNLQQTIEKLKAAGFWIVATTMASKVDYRQEKYDAPMALVVGNEGKGIRKKLIEQADINVSLPLYGPIESLNVSVATALMLYEIKQKQIKLDSNEKEEK